LIKIIKSNEDAYDVLVNQEQINIHRVNLAEDYRTNQQEEFGSCGQDRSPDSSSGSNIYIMDQY
jgi:hypothetical protein